MCIRDSSQPVRRCSQYISYGSDKQRHGLQYKIRWSLCLLLSVLSVTFFISVILYCYNNMYSCFCQVFFLWRQFISNSSDGGKNSAKAGVELAHKTVFALFFTSDGHPMLLDRFLRSRRWAVWTVTFIMLLFTTADKAAYVGKFTATVNSNFIVNWKRKRNTGAAHLPL